MSRPKHYRENCAFDGKVELPKCFPLKIHMLLQISLRTSVKVTRPTGLLSESTTQMRWTCRARIAERTSKRLSDGWQQRGALTSPLVVKRKYSRGWCISDIFSELKNRRSEADKLAIRIPHSSTTPIAPTFLEYIVTKASTVRWLMSKTTGFGLKKAETGVVIRVGRSDAWESMNRITSVWLTSCSLWASLSVLDCTKARRVCCENASRRTRILSVS
mmetsp:Transcript_332/g.706  ORF Transcript_332/g.706 Transcript_332/m.706 type:complete len:217 (+) Transcript_332:410-1060(+)